jgi:hypothetical protein
MHRDFKARRYGRRRDSNHEIIRRMKWLSKNCNQKAKEHARSRG